MAKEIAELWGVLDTDTGELVARNTKRMAKDYRLYVLKAHAEYQARHENRKRELPDRFRVVPVVISIGGS